MQPEPPIFLLTADSTFLDVRRNVADAEQHLAGDHLGGDSSAADLVCFDGLARPVEARRDGDRVRLTVSQALPDPWQVRARVDRAVLLRRKWLEDQGEEIAMPGGGRTVSHAEAEEALRALGGVDPFTGFAEFAVALSEAFEPEGPRHSGSFLHNLFHF